MALEVEHGRLQPGVTGALGHAPGGMSSSCARSCSPVSVSALARALRSRASAAGSPSRRAAATASSCASFHSAYGLPVEVARPQRLADPADLQIQLATARQSQDGEEVRALGLEPHERLTVVTKPIPTGGSPCDGATIRRRSA